MTRDSKLEKPRIGAPTVLATLSLNVLALAMPLVILQIFDRVITFGSMHTLGMLVLGLVIVIGLETILRAVRVILLSSVSETYERELNLRFVSKTLSADPSYYKKTTEAEHLERFAAIARLRGFYAGQGRLASIELPFALLFIVMIGLIGGWLVLVPIVGVLALLWFTSILVRLQEPIFEERNTLDARRYAFLIEVLSQIGSIKLNTMEHQMLRRFEMMQRKTTENSQRTILYSGLSQSFGAVYSQTSLAAMALFGGFLVIQGNVGIAELAACMLLNGRTIQPFVKMLGVWAQSESIAASEKKLMAAFSMPTPALVRDASPVTIEGSVEIADLTVRHDGSDTPVISNLSARIRAGDCVSIIGDDGQGKSALLKTLFGEVVPTAGRVLVDGRPVTRTYPQRGESGIVFVGVDAATFNGTILQNISAFGDGGKVDHALELSHAFGLEERVHRLPMGYNSHLGESGQSVLDASSLKLVTLVRALVIQPRILLLQDPTYGVDRTLRRKLVEYLAGDLHKMTVIATTQDDLLIGASQDTIHLKDSDVAHWHVDAEADRRLSSALGLAS